MKSVISTCPIAKVAQLLSDTWTMLIMHYLIEGPRRFCELEKALVGISTRTLTLKLRKLQLDGMIQKDLGDRYVATKKGSGLQVIESAMKRYQKKYLT